MSKGAMKELVNSNLVRFKRMVLDVPSSEKKSVIAVLEHRQEILDGA